MVTATHGPIVRWYHGRGGQDDTTRRHTTCFLIGALMKHFPLLHRLALPAIGTGLVVACHNSTSSASRTPADAQSPAAGICAPIATPVVIVIMNADAPSARCTQ